MKTLLLIAASILPHDAHLVRESVDMIERNTYYDGEGKRVFCQWIFWQWSGSRHDVVAWRMDNQERIITGYVNGTKVVTVNYAWVTNPDATSVYTIMFDNAPKIDSNLKISGLVLADTLTTYTGNTLQTANVATLITTVGTAGAGLTNLGDTRIANLDASVSSRMATYTQPTGFLAATFPTDPAGLAGLASAHGAGSWITATGFSTHSAADVWAVATRVLTAGTNIQLPNNGLGNVTAWTVNITGTLSGNVGGIAGTTQTLDALQTALNSTHGAGSWATATGFSTLTTTDIDNRLAAYDAPTHAEMTAELATADDAMLAAIAALNNLSSAQVIAAVPTANQNAAAILDLADAIETGLTVRKALRAIAAKSAGSVAGAGTGTETIAGAGVATNRLTATVDSSGNVTWSTNL